MAFHYVDRIIEFDPGRRMRGIKNVTRNESLFYWLPDGRRVLSPAVASEAAAQLGSWLTMASTDFARRPVLLADERTEYFGFVEPGDQLDMEVTILESEGDVALTRGVVRARGAKVLESVCCRGFLLPTSEFCDPEWARREFANMFRPDTVLEPLPRAAMPTPAIAGPGTFDSLRYVDGIVEHVPGRKVVGFKNFTRSEPYFADHFPRKPVVPGVLLLTFIGETAQHLLRERVSDPLRAKALVPAWIRDVRFRKFVEPGDQCVLTAEVRSGDTTRHGEDIVVAVKIGVGTQRVMQAEMGFRTMFGRLPWMAPWVQTMDPG